MAPHTSFWREKLLIRRKTILILSACIFTGAPPAHGESFKRVIVSLVDLAGRPVEGVSIADANLSEPSAASDSAGFVLLKLSAEAKVGDQFRLVVLAESWHAVEEYRVVPAPGQTLPLRVVLIKWKELVGHLQGINDQQQLEVTTYSQLDRRERALNEAGRQLVIQEYAESEGLTKQQLDSAAEALSASERASLVERALAEMVSGTPEKARHYLGSAYQQLRDELVDANTRAEEIRAELGLTARYEAQLLRNDGRFLDALRKYLEALSFSPDSPETHWELARLLLAEGRDFEAEAWATRAVRITSNNRPEKHAYALAHLSLVARFRGDSEREIELLSQAASTMASVVGPDNEKTLDLVSSLAKAYGDSGRLTEAESLQRVVLRRLSQTLGPLAVQTLKEQGNLAVTAGRKGGQHEKRVLLEFAFLGFCHTLGEDHPLTALTRLKLAWLGQQRGDYEPPGDAPVKPVFHFRADETEPRCPGLR